MVETTSGCYSLKNKKTLSVVLCCLLAGGLASCATQQHPVGEETSLVAPETPPDGPKSPLGYTLHHEPNKTLTEPLNGFQEFEIIDYDTLNQQTGHNGIHIITPANTPVYSIGNGTIRTVGFRNGLGNRLIIDYVYNNDLLSITYGNLSPESLKTHQSGDMVNQGEQIGETSPPDATIKLTTPRLHFEATIQGLPIHTMVWADENLTEK